METEKPSWIDALFAQKILRKIDDDESIEVFAITVNAATARGDNYTSDMYRVAIKFLRVLDGHEIEEQKSIIVKVAPQDDLRIKMVDEVGHFVKELAVMSKTLPTMNEILQKFGMESLSARCLSIQNERPTHIVLEDLASKGFRMAERYGGLDLDHSLLVIKNIGRFHAASIALKEKDAKALTNYKTGMFHKDQSSMVCSYFNTGAKALADEVAQWPEVSRRIPEKLLKLSNVLFDKASEAILYEDDDFNVLNHGDCWLNNMMFRYDEQQGKPIDHIFVDFQLSFHGSFAFDLLFFLGTSPSDDVRLNHRELILREYHASLARTMKKLKCKTEVLSFEKLQEILKKRALCEVIAAFGILGLVVREKAEEVDVTKIIKLNGECGDIGFHGKLYRKVISRLLPWYDSMGLLDV